MVILKILVPRSDCKKKGAHIKYAAYLKKLFRPPSLSALLSTHFSENAPLLPSSHIQKKPDYFGSQTVGNVFYNKFSRRNYIPTTGFLCNKRGKKIITVRFLPFFPNFKLFNLSWRHSIYKADISAANEVLCANAPGQNANSSNKNNGS